MKVAVCYALCALIWGTTWFAIRESTPVGGFPTYLGAALRFSLAAAILWAMTALGVGRPLPRGRRLAWLIAAGVVNGVGYVLVYFAERDPGGLPGGLMAVLFGTIPLVTAVAATALRLERISAGQVAGALVSLIGIVVISVDRMQVGGGQAISIAAALAGVALSVGYSILVRKGMAGVHPLAATTVFLSVTTIVTWLAAAHEVDRMPWPPPLGPSLATIYLAVFGSVIAFACYFYLLKHVSLMVANSLVLLQPVIALAVDAAFERRVALAPTAYVGALITLAGVAVNLVVKGRAARSGVAGGATPASRTR